MRSHHGLSRKSRAAVFETPEYSTRQAAAGYARIDAEFGRGEGLPP